MTKSLNRLGSIIRILIFSLILIGGSLVGLGYSTAEAELMPTIKEQTTNELSISTSTGAPVLAASNPVTNAFIYANPNSNGDVDFLVSGVTGSGNLPDIILNMDPDNVGGGHRRSYAMSLSGSSYQATAIGFALQQDVKDRMKVDAEFEDNILSTNEINYVRAYVETTLEETVSLDDGDFELSILNQDTFENDVYLFAMSTNAPPPALPLGYISVGRPYNISPSGGLTQSEKVMTMLFKYREPLPDNSPPQNLALLGWNPTSDEWEFIGGTLNISDQIELITKHFRVYLLTVSPIWRDSFFNPDGVAAKDNTTVEGLLKFDPGDIVLIDTPGSGTVTSVPITPPADIDRWKTFDFNATLPPNTGLTIDILDENDGEVLTNVEDGADLSGLLTSDYPTLKLRATLTSAITGTSPSLHDWQISWTPESYNIYLPTILK